MNEFDLINHIKKRFKLGRIGDDCAVLPMDHTTDWLITADMLVESVDFRLDWTRPSFIGHKALAVSLSDIAAMGGVPKYALLSLAIPEKLWDVSFLDAFYEGWHHLARELNVELVGGDISRTPSRFVIDSTVVGEVPKGKAVLRSGAKPGDSIYITAPLGAAAAGLEILKSGRRPGAANQDDVNELVLAQLRPDPRTITGIQIRSNLEPSAMIDISDGLSSDLHHICSASGVGAVIYTDKIPIHPAIDRTFSSESSKLDLALHGGEDLELIFTVDENKFSGAQFDRFHRIGEVTANAATIELITDGVARELESKGYFHFE